MLKFISNFDEEDIAAISLDVNSTSLWTISPPSLRKLKDDLISDVPIKIRISISVSRLTHGESIDTVEANQIMYLSKSHHARQELLRAMIQLNQNHVVQFSHFLPKFIKVCTFEIAFESKIQ